MQREHLAQDVPEGWPGAVPVTRAALEKTDFLPSWRKKTPTRREDARLAESALRRCAARATP